MLFSRLKSSTTTALIFTFFTSVLLVLFVVMINIYYFYTWNFDEKGEIADKTEQTAMRIMNTQDASGMSMMDKTNQFFNKIVEQGGVIEIYGSGTLSSPQWGKYKPNILGLYQSGSNWYMYYTFPFRDIGTIKLPYNVTEHINGQASLLGVSLFLTLFFLIIIGLISLFFASYSLRPLSKIVRYIHSFRVDEPMADFHLSGPKNDEFMIVAKALSDAFRKIQSQTETLRQFSIDAAHEFKTPLMIIHSEIDCAIKSGDYQTGMNNIRNQLYFLDTMISTLLTIARLEKEEIKKEEVNVSVLLEEITFETAYIFREKGLRVLKNIEKDVILESNQSMLQIILSNLLSNAFNYTNDGEIEITLDSHGFSARDTGIGIVKENIDKIWDRLYRVNSSWSVQNGHGLGLFLVKTVVEKLGYSIRVESEAGKGSVFSVDFGTKNNE